MLVLIDNYDSFTFNLVQVMGAAKPGLEIKVLRNDKTTVDEVESLRPSHIVISPGPCTPKEAGISNDVLTHFAPKIPVLGVCLGHQCIGQVFGGDVIRAPEVMHGKTSSIHHTGTGVFAGLPEPLEATRYHSLVVDPDTVPDVLEVTATTTDGVIMGLRHRRHWVEGVQFHPESILTSAGHDLLRNFLAAAGQAATTA